MSRMRVKLDADGDGRMLLVGYDRPFSTYYAMLYTPDGEGRRVGDEPDKAVGYHPAERTLGEITEHGPYPCDIPMLATTLIGWGLSGAEVKRACEIAKGDPDAPK